MLKSIVMRYVTYVSIGIVVCGLAAVIATWSVIPSGTELRAHAFTLRYATEVLDRNGHHLTYLHSPDAVAVGHSNGGRGYNRPGPFVSINDVPEDLIEDLVAIEKLRPLGFSPASFARAIYTWNGGASTISQQVYTSIVGYKEHSLWRKWAEMIGAVKLSLSFSRDEILETYLNRIPWMDSEIVGLAYAARWMYDKHPSELERHEWLHMMARISRPSAALEDREAAYRNRVSLLYSKGRLSDEERGRLMDQWSTETSPPDTPVLGPFVDRVRDQLHQLGGDQTASALEVVTSLDAQVQETVDEHLASIEEGTPTFLLMNSKKEVLGYYGNPYPGDFDLLNRAVSPASRFKTLVYASYIDTLQQQGLSSTAIQRQRLPTRFELGSGKIVHDRRANAGFANLRESLVHSYNAPAYTVAERVGAQQLASFTRSLDISISPFLSAALGTQPVSELDLASAYATLLLRRGRTGKPTFIRRIRDRRTGNVLYAHDAAPDEMPAVVSETTSQTLRDILGATTRVGTARGLTDPNHEDSLWLTNNLTGKTGTSSNESGYRVLGITGTIGHHVYSLSVQGYGVSRSAYSSTTAVPPARRTLHALCTEGHIEC